MHSHFINTFIANIGFEMNNSDLECTVVDPLTILHVRHIRCKAEHVVRTFYPHNNQIIPAYAHQIS